MSRRRSFDPNRLKSYQPPPKAHRDRLFDADASADDDAPSSENEVKAMTVGQLNAMIKSRIDAEFPPIEVVGELANLRAQNHWFFSMRDDDQVINCVMYRSRASRVSFEPANGQQVVAKGRLGYYGNQGRLQLYVDTLQPHGMGALEQQLRQMCEKLRARGWFDEARKKPMPAFPRRIAMVTSASGAAMHDVLRTASQRLPGVQWLIADVRVQGNEAAAQIARAVRHLSSKRAQYQLDALVITRGGGSLEDLWAFNEMIVAEAIYEAELPVIAAIGHEVDTTVAELVADLRCSTPTQVAERLVPDQKVELDRMQRLSAQLCRAATALITQRQDELRYYLRLTGTDRPGQMIIARQEHLHHARQRLVRQLHHRMHMENQRLDHAQAGLARIAPHHAIQQSQQQISRLTHRLQHRVKAMIAQHHVQPSQYREQLMRLGQRQIHARRDTIDQARRQLNAVGPRRVLERGYTLTLDETGSLIRSIQQTHPGGKMTTVFADGRIISRIESEAGNTDHAANPEQPPTEKLTSRQSPKKKSAPKSRTADDQPELFS